MIKTGCRSNSNYFFKIFIVFSFLVATSVAFADDGHKEFSLAKILNPTRITILGSNAPVEYGRAASNVSVLDENKIVAAGNDSFQNVINSIPNLNFSSGSNRPRFFQIRGVGELEQYEGAPNSSVAIIVDEVDLTGVSAALSLFDVSQLEVHRGPQAIRFGSSALAGAIYIKTKEAGASKNGQYQTSFGNDNLEQVGIALSDSLSENTRLRATGFVHQQNGYRKNDFLGLEDTNKRDEYLGRAKLEIQPSSDFKITSSFSQTRYDNNYDAFSILNGFHTQSDRPGKDAETLKLISLNAEYKHNQDIIINSISSYYETASLYSFDGDWGNNQFWKPYAPYDYFSKTDRNRKVFAEQLRALKKYNLNKGEASWLQGAYFQDFRENSFIDEFSDNIVYDELSSKYEARTYSYFTNITYPISSKLDFSVGARAEYRDMEYVDSRSFVSSPNNFMTGGTSELSYKASKDKVYYALVSRGFKGGGFNANPSLSEEQLIYSPESLINYELGLKASYFNNNLSFSINSFYNQRNNQQIKLGVQIDPNDPLSFSYINQNAAKGESYGLESESLYRLSKKLYLGFNAALMESRILNASDEISYLEGRNFSHAPTWQYSFSTDYYIKPNLDFKIALQGKDSFYFDDSHTEESKPYSLINTSLRYFYKNWELQLWSRNLFNKKYATRGFYFGNEPPDFSPKQYVQLGDPRTFGLTAIYRF